MSAPARHLTALVVALALSAACGGSTNPPAPTPGGNQGETITGRERIGWDQQAASAGELGTFRYAAYVDGARSELGEVSCATSAAATGFACSARLPSMAAGTHTVELVSFTIDGSAIVESARSSPLRLTVTGATAGDGPIVPWTSGDAGRTTDGIRLRVERVAEGLVNPVDAAVTPDGVLIVAERSGRILALEEGRLRELPVRIDDELAESGAIVGLTLDAEFERTRHAYVLYTAPSRDGLVYRLARFRAVAGTLGERAVLLNSIAPAREPPAGVVRSAPDGRLLIALGSIGVTTALSYDGKLLRFERDGTLPSAPATAPILLGGLESPGGLAWDATRAFAWIVDRRDDAGVLNALDPLPSWVPRVRHAQRLKDRDAGSMAVYEGTLNPSLAGNVLVASNNGRHILRLQIDATSGRLVGEPLLQDLVGGILVVAVAPDGSIYFCTAEAIGRITAQP